MEQAIDRVIREACKTLNNIYSFHGEEAEWSDVWHEVSSELELIVRQEIRRRGSHLPAERWEQEFYFWILIDKLTDLKGAEPGPCMLEELSEIIFNLLPRMKDHYESLPGKYYEQISVQEILYALAGYIMNFDSPKDYIDEAIQQIKTTYNIA